MIKMSRHATDVPGSQCECVPSPPLPADHVLDSGAVLFPGAFDQHGCPLIVFPVDGQAKLSSELSKAEVVDFINYFLCLHNKKQEEESLVSVVADLRQASLPTTRFIAETLLLLELHKRTVHSVYIVQPKKKDVVKLMQKLLAPAKSHSASFKKVFLKEISELSNYIDRSQLTASLGGYLIYCHQSWVSFIKEIHVFLQEFLSVVQRLPSYVSTLQSLSRLPLPSTFRELQHFCSTNEAKFQQLRRELGLDELLRHCDRVVGKLRHPEKEPCYQAMAGTALFIHTAFDMLQNHSRITAAVEKVELLWQQAFSQARLQLQVFQLREDALQEKLQPYKVGIAKDAMKAVAAVSHFEASIHTPAVALVRCAEDVIHRLAEFLPVDARSRECWVSDLERLKEKLSSAVHFILQTLRAVSNYHHYFSRANTWYTLVLCENFLQELLSGVNADGAPKPRQRRTRGPIPAWRHKLSTFLKKHCPPDVEELVHLAHLSNVIPDDTVQQAGKQMSQRCMTLRKLVTSSGPVAVAQLQQALQWQYELLRSRHVSQSCDTATDRPAQDVQDGPPESSLIQCESGNEAVRPLEASPSTAVSGLVSAEGKPPSLSSFDSGFDGAGSSQLEAWGGREGAEGLSRSAGTRDSARPATSHPLIQEENISSVSDLEFDCGSLGSSSKARIQIIPKVSEDSLNFEIKVKRSAALPTNPWLSLPLDDLENMYTVTITHNPTPHKSNLQFFHPSDPHTNANPNRSRDPPTKMEEVLCSTQPTGPQSRGCVLEDLELSPISHILSSTITDGRDQSICTTEGGPTLLWDSYDLHDQDQDPVESVIDISQKDWDEKEQQGLREVEEILGRADEILEEEENVLAQEAVLEALLRSEVGHSPWPLWDSEDQLGVMSSSELIEAGVLALGDYLDPAGPDNLSEPRSTGSASETKTSEDDGCCTDAATEADTAAFQSRPDLLTELRTVHVLDELIMEENLKIHKLRRCEENPGEDLLGRNPADTNGPSSVSKEREAFRLQLEKEKREVENLEKSLDKERKVKKHKDRARKVVKCSIMDKARGENKEDQALCEELLSEGSNRSHRTRSTVVDLNEDTCKTENPQAKLLPGVGTETISQDGVQELPSSEAAASGCNFSDTFDLKQPSEELGIEPQGHVCGEGLDGSKPEASLTPEMRPEGGAFDPGGQALLPVNDDLTQCTTSHSTELLDPDPSSAAPDPCFVQLDPQDESFGSENVTPAVSLYFIRPKVQEQSNNNNNHSQKCGPSFDLWSEMTSKDESVEPAGLLQTDLHAAVEIQTVSPPDECPHQQLPPDQAELNEDWPVGYQNSEVLRISGSGSPGLHTQLDMDTREMMDFKTPIVLDTGSGLMKAGFADQDRPNIMFPTIIGTPKYEDVMNSSVEREIYIGHEAQHMRGVLALQHPIKNGIIRNWDEMEKIWHYAFQQLRMDPEDHPVLLTEAAMNPLENRQRMVEIMFECFNVPLTYVAMQAVLALYAAGRSTGVVFDSGDGVSHSVPVFEGYCLPHAVHRFHLAGADVTMQLKKLLQEQGVSMRTTAELEIVREMKEMCCRVALDYEAELTQGGSSCREMYYTMPDGQIVTLSSERFRAPEILFKPELIGKEHCGMHESIFKSVLSSDIDLRCSFLGNIVLSGGNTLMPGLPERLQAEIKHLVPADMGESVRVTSPTDRDFSVWSGGAVLANLPTFSSAWIRQEEYAEFGPQIVFRKCF
ncbi:uncharacterized protein [Trachinotus anak]|uniref:uncharacterized protein isoform X2 n=1 Tax=Trachinotus anak TaxID=443729 RepID=UPI0039F20DC1